MLLNKGDNLGAVEMEKAEVLSTFLPKSSRAMITPTLLAVSGFSGKEQVTEDKLGTS